MTATTREPVEFDPMSSVYFDDPYEVYRRLRDEAPVYYSERYGFYALSRYEDVTRASKETDALSSTYGSEFFEVLKRTQHPEGMRSLINMDPPEHDRMRALVSKVFTPRAIGALEPMVREVIGGILDERAGRESFDVVEEFSALFPVEIISRMLGVPADERQAIRAWLEVALHREEGQTELSAANVGGFTDLFTYMYGLVAARRAEPRDDMVSRLVAAEVERDDGTKTQLDDHEISAFAGLLGAAGAETVIKLVGNAVVLFAAHPEVWQRLVADPSSIPVAIEEVLRLQPPSQYQGRFSVQDSEYHGVTIPAGHPVFLLTGAACRDERAFPDPDSFVLGRPRTIPHLSFGYGVHSCLGAALARLEARVAVEEIAKRYPHFRVDEAGLRRVQMSNVAGWSNVPFHPLASG